MVLVYDAGERRSFENVMRWVQDIKQHATEREVMVMLVANKVDLPKDQRVISSEMGRKVSRRTSPAPAPLLFPDRWLAFQSR